LAWAWSSGEAHHILAVGGWPGAENRGIFCCGVTAGVRTVILPVDRSALHDKVPAMQLEKALSQISEIHAQVLKTEVFRGYRAATMLLTAAVALTAAWLQGSVFVPTTPAEFTVFWVSVAIICALICAADILRGTLRVTHRVQRWKTVLVVAQSVPALLVGAIITGVLLQRPGHECLLPGLWSVTFALGIWSARPYMPKAIGIVALFYLLAGTWLLVRSDGAVPSPWGMGITFAVGQAATAVVLYLNIERPVFVPSQEDYRG
jgi:hypothetical protein